MKESKEMTSSIKRNRKPTRREAHVAYVYATETNPEEYLRRERAIKFQPVRNALEAIGVTAGLGLSLLAAYLFLAIA